MSIVGYFWHDCCCVVCDVWVVGVMVSIVRAAWPAGCRSNRRYPTSKIILKFFDIK